MTNQDRKNEGWEFVTGLRKDGFCCSPQNTGDEVSTLSSDTEYDESDTASIGDNVLDESSLLQL